jgi:FkbM family methyltransferase
MKRVRSSDGQFNYELLCHSEYDAWRARTLRTKEPGTVEWIRREVRAGDVFVDVGANIGLYTLLAAKRVGATGHVYAFEPHLGNAGSLLENVRRNGLSDRVSVCSVALHHLEGFFPFNYSAMVSGSSMSQLGETRTDSGAVFQPVMAELKCGVTLDHLIDSGVVRRPTLVKLDVDGNELQVLEGMRQLLSSSRPPRCIQVELGRRAGEAVRRFMHAVGYQFERRHDTDIGERRIREGADPALISHNALFRPAAN